MNSRVDFKAPRVVFRRWKEYFLDCFEDEDEDELEYGMNDLSGSVSVMGMPPGIKVADVNKIFDYWVAETNFSITRNMYNEINNLEGVESLNKLSPYKIRVAIGQLFNDREVRRNISNVLKKYNDY